MRALDKVNINGTEVIFPDGGEIKKIGENIINVETPISLKPSKGETWIK